MPSLNQTEPVSHYQWRVLPQGMLNSPTLSTFCRTGIKGSSEYVSYCLHRSFLDDILLAAPTHQILHQLFRETKQALTKWNLKIAPEKVQRTSLYQYLGIIVTETSVCPQKVVLCKDRLQTLHDFQQLLGDIN